MLIQGALPFTSGKSTEDREKQNAFVSGLRFFKSATQLAEGYGFTIEKSDNLQDQAVLYERAAEYTKALVYMNEVRQAIPNEHKFEKDRGLADLPPETRVDAYFKLMGMVELLHGAVIYDQGLSADDLQNRPSKEIILEMMEHYVLAIAYFNARRRYDVHQPPHP